MSNPVNYPEANEGRLFPAYELAVEYAELFRERSIRSGKTALSTSNRKWQTAMRLWQDICRTVRTPDAIQAVSRNRKT